jgi:2,5-diamino-6-(ribosylamino)-4(3H)-pyrimidinone 5'-phosphate reductase
MPLPCLAFLRRERIPYLVAGERRVDLALAQARKRTSLGAECVVSEARRRFNGALLRAGLVAEFHVITVPALTGGPGTPSVMDRPPLAAGALPVRLRAADVGAADPKAEVAEVHFRCPRPGEAADA